MNLMTHRASLGFLVIGLLVSPMANAQSLEMSVPAGSAPIQAWSFSAEADSSANVQTPIIDVVRFVDDLSPGFYDAASRFTELPSVTISGGVIELELGTVLVKSVEVDTSVSPNTETVRLVYDTIRYSSSGEESCWSYTDDAECL